MLTLTAVKNEIFRLKKYQEPMEKWLFPLIIFLYPFIGVSQGVDVTDTTYSLGNYVYSGTIDPMWFLATFIPNLMGKLFTLLPGGDGMLGMNIYCTIFICITALSAYYMLQRWIPGWMTFLGEMIAISLCWCPRVILYNYMTYMFFTLGVLMLLHAMTDYEKKAYRFALAGVFFGLNVMVRFPNIVETALIVILVYYEVLHKREKEVIFKKLGYCVLGFFIGFISPFLIICIAFGFSAYPQMIGSLFAMSEGASDYSGAGMLALILGAWWSSLRHMLIIAPFMMAAAILLMLKPGKYYWIKRLLYVAGLLVLVRYFFKSEIITRSYFYYDSMFEPAMMFLIAGLVFLVLGVTPLLHGQASERSFCLASILIILITPLGSNNYTYPVINNLFIVAPVILWMFRRVRQAAGKSELNFTWKAMFIMLLTVLCIQGGLFHVYHSFVDGTDGEKRDTVVGSQDVPRAAGMHTTKNNAKTLTDLYEFLCDNDLQNKRLLQFGKAPGLSYLFKMEPAIFSTWPDLDSNTVEKFAIALDSYGGANASELPVVIVNPDLEGEVLAEEKSDLLLDFLHSFKYNNVFDNGRFIVYAVSE
jgi:hypothetical protein